MTSILFPMFKVFRESMKSDINGAKIRIHSLYNPMTSMLEPVYVVKVRKGEENERGRRIRKTKEEEEEKSTRGRDEKKTVYLFLLVFFSSSSAYRLGIRLFGMRLSHAYRNFQITNVRKANEHFFSPRFSFLLNFFLQRLLDSRRHVQVTHILVSFSKSCLFFPFFQICFSILRNLQTCQRTATILFAFDAKMAFLQSTSIMKYESYFIIILLILLRVFLFAFFFFLRASS